MLLGGVFVFSAAAAVFCEPALELAGQPSDVARASARFAQVQLIGVPFFWAWTAMKSALDSTKRTFPGLLSSIVSSVAQILFCLLLTHPKMLDMGYLGLALGRAFGGMVLLLCIIVHIQLAGLQSLVWRLHPEAPPVNRPGALVDYLKVSIPSALIVWSEWWAFEVLSLLVGMTPNAEVNLAAHATMFNLIVISYMTFTGTSNAVCALVGNKLGERRNQDVRPLLRAARTFSLGTSLTVALLYEMLKGTLAVLFTEDLEVREVIRNSSMGVVLSVPLYAQLMTFYGALRGANRQRPGILGTLVGYWFIGLPLGYLLGCVLHWPTPLNGVWAGNVVALAIAASWVCISVFCRIDWMSVVRIAGSSVRLLEHGANCAGTPSAGVSSALPAAEPGEQGQAKTRSADAADPECPASSRSNVPYGRMAGADRSS